MTYVVVMRRLIIRQQRYLLFDFRWRNKTNQSKKNLLYMQQLKCTSIVLVVHNKIMVVIIMRAAIPLRLKTSHNLICIIGILCFKTMASAAHYYFLAVLVLMRSVVGQTGVVLRTDTVVLAYDAWTVCPFYEIGYTKSATTNAIVCTFELCPGDLIDMRMCSNGGSCLGDTFLRLFDSTNSEVFSNDDHCGICAGGTYTVGGEVCGNFSLQQGCFYKYDCSGQVIINRIDPTVSGDDYYSGSDDDNGYSYGANDDTDDGAANGSDDDLDNDAFPGTSVLRTDVIELSYNTWELCPEFSIEATNTSIAKVVVCKFELCPTDQIYLRVCTDGGCPSDNLRLYDSQNNIMLLYDQYCGDCAGGSVSYGGKVCDTFYLRQGCYSKESCTGQSSIYKFQENMNPVPEAEVAALAELYDHNNGQDWIWPDGAFAWDFSSSDSTYSICSPPFKWYGITCDCVRSMSQCYVVGVILPEVGLTGQISEVSFGSLTYLESLDLSRNLLFGKLVGILNLEVFVYSNFSCNVCRPYPREPYVFGFPSRSDTVVQYVNWNSARTTTEYK